MITKLMVIVKEIYEEEETETKYININTQKQIDTWDFERLLDEDQKQFVKQEIPTGRMERKEKEEAEYAQTFELKDLKVPDLVLYLNRIK